MIEFVAGLLLGISAILALVGMVYGPRPGRIGNASVTALFLTVVGVTIDLTTGVTDPWWAWFVGWGGGMALAAVTWGVTVAVQRGRALPNRSDEYDEKIANAQRTKL